jgi:hypothetical protein
MTVKELIKRLQKYDPSMRVMIDDCGLPASVVSVHEYEITEEDGNDSGDCEDIVGVMVVRLSS